MRRDDGYAYYSYILYYVDDILVIHHDSFAILKIVYSYFKINPTPIGDPDMYLGPKVKKMTIDN